MQPLHFQPFEKHIVQRNVRTYKVQKYKWSKSGLFHYNMLYMRFKLMPSKPTDIRLSLSCIGLILPLRHCLYQYLMVNTDSEVRK
jgi:hypothetical protein